MDEWGRFIAPHLGRNIPGNPDIVVQNMPGAGTTIAANYIYNIVNPDGLTLGLVNPSIYMDQLLGAKEVRFDWPKFSVIWGLFEYTLEMRWPAGFLFGYSNARKKIRRPEVPDSLLRETAE